MKKRAKAHSIFSSNKKGNVILDSSFVAIVIVIFAVISILAYTIFGDLNTDIQSDTSLDELTQNTSGGLYNRFTATFDSGIVMALILFWILTLVATFMIDTHPAFFIVSVIILIFLFIACVMLGNSYEEMMQDADLSASATSFTMTHFILTHYLIFIVIMSMSILLMLYMKNKYLS